MKWFLVISFLLISSCGERANFLDHAPLQKIDELQVDENIYPLTLLEIDNDIDVVMIVDNSGSMGTIQQNVIKNAGIFFEQFAKQQLINWKLGIISTDNTEDPYLGFRRDFSWKLIKASDPLSFDSTVATFQSAFGKLGINGSHNEHVFQSMDKMLDKFNGTSMIRPSFTRKNAHLAVVMISDEKEQSASSYGSAYEALNYYNKLSLQMASNRILRFYGAIKLKGLQDCVGGYDSYAGSEYEKIINESKGFVISACRPDFGNELARIGKDIKSFVGNPRLLLKNRPVVKTIKIFYKGKLLPPGRKENGGYWFYDEGRNSITFYGTEFIENVQTDVFEIDFDIDDGWDRD